MVMLRVPGKSRTAIWEKENKEFAFKMYGDKCSVCGTGDDVYLKFNRDENGKTYTIGYAKAMCYGKKYAYLVCGSCRHSMFVSGKTIEQMQERLRDPEFLEDHRKMQAVRKGVNDNAKETIHRNEELLKNLNPGARREHL